MADAPSSAAPRADRSPGAPTLVLVPTAAEARLIEHGRSRAPGSGLFALCGFGPVASAAQTARQLALLKPHRVLLLGVAGSFDLDAAPIGSAVAFTRVRLDGVGAGEGEGFLDPRALGLPQWDGDDTQIYDDLSLARSPGLTMPRELLTVCSCSASDEEAERRRSRTSSPLAEDMEGFAVALACQIEGVPVAIVRGISNEVGNRDTRSWRIAEAMQAAWSLARECLETEWEPAR